MSKISCDVVKDLIPSYIENLCSEDSREIVNEHISNCEDCKKLLEVMQQTELVSHSANVEQIDYMKKVKKHYYNKNILILFFYNVFILIGLLAAITGGRFIPLSVYLVVYPVLALSGYFILTDQLAQKKNDIWEILLSGIGVILLCYSMIITLYYISNLDRMAGGLLPSEVGPLLYRQYVIIALAQMAMYIGRIALKLKKESAYSVGGLTVHLIGCCLVCGFIGMLYNMDTKESFIRITYQFSIALILEGIVVSAIILLINKYRKKAIN